MSPHQTTPQPSLRDLAELGDAVATALAKRGLVGPLKPLAVSQEEAGALLGVSARSIRSWITAGKLTACQVGPGTVRIPFSSIEALLASTSTSIKKA